MISSKNACELLRQLEGVTEKDHFGSDAFAANKRNFATVWHEEGNINLRFSPEQQRHFLETDSEAFSEINNGFGRMGWTTMWLKHIDRPLFQKAIEAAWQHSSVKVSFKKSKPAAKLKTKKTAAKKVQKKKTKGAK